MNKPFVSLTINWESKSFTSYQYCGYKDCTNRNNESKFISLEETSQMFDHFRKGNVFT